MKKNFAKRIAAASLSLAMLAAPVLSVGVGAEEEKAPLYTVSFYRDAEKTQSVKAEEIAAGETVYYTVDLADGAFYTVLFSNAEYTDDEKMIFGEGTREVTTDAVIAGDMNLDGKLDIVDLVRGMKYISNGYADIDDALNYDVSRGRLAFDTNFDGTIDVRDLVRAMKMISGAEVSIDPRHYTGARANFTCTVYNSALNENVINNIMGMGEELLNFDIFAPLTTVDELNAYLEKLQKIVDLKADLTYADGKVHNEKKLDIDAVKAKYNAEYFENNSLIIANFIAVDEQIGPNVSDVYVSGSHNPMIRYELGSLDIDEDYVPVGAVLALTHSFIELPKLEVISETDSVGDQVNCWMYSSILSTAWFVGVNLDDINLPI